MAHSYISALFHCVFSTKDRRRSITEDLEERLWKYLGGISRQNKMRALVIGGVEDHVHLLLSIPSTSSIAKAMQLIKGGSSKWVHETFSEHKDFEWQEGYGAFSVGMSQVDDTKGDLPAINCWAIFSLSLRDGMQLAYWRSSYGQTHGL